MNGKHEKTAVFRHDDDSVINFKYDEIVIVDKFDVGEFFYRYDELKDDYNVILDIRLSLLINYFIIYHDFELLVFDPYKEKTLSLMQYLSQEHYIVGFEFSIDKIKVILMVRILFIHYFKDAEIPWCVRKTVQEIRNCFNTSKYKILINVLLNLVGVKKTESSKEKNIKRIVRLVKVAFSESFRVDYQTIDVSLLSGISDYEIYSALLILRDLEVVI